MEFWSFYGKNNDIIVLCKEVLCKEILIAFVKKVDILFLMTMSQINI